MWGGRVHQPSLPKAILVLFLTSVMPLVSRAALADSNETETPSPAAVQRLFEQLRYEDARVMASGLLSEAEAQHGAMSLEVADASALLVQAWLESSHTRSPELLARARRAVEIREGLEGHESVELAASLSSLADACKALDQRADAVPARRRALGIHEVLEGSSGPAVAGVLVKLGDDLRRGRQAEEAIQLLERAREIREAHFGPDSAEAAEVLSELALTLPEADSRRKPLALKALAIRERGASRPQDLARALTVLAIVLEADERDFDAAKDLYLRALNAIEGVFGPDDRRLDFILNNLGISLYYSGDVLGAQSVFERALRIRERLLGSEHSEVSQLTSNLGVMYWDTGRLDRARELLSHALEVQRRTLGEDHEYVARTLGNLAGLYETEGDLERARRTHEQALAIFRKTGPESRLTKSMSNLGRVLRELGDYESGARLLTEALERQEALWGPLHQDVGQTRAYLGALYDASGRHAEAVAMLERAVEILLATAGPQGHGTATARHYLGRAYANTGRWQLALRTGLELESATRETFRTNAHTFTEKEALDFSSRRVNGLAVALTALEDPARYVAEDAPRRVFDQLIRSRALALDELASRHPHYLGQSTPELRALVSKLDDARDELARLAIAHLSGEQLESHDSELERAKRNSDEAELELAQRSRRYRARSQRWSIGLDEVSAALPAGSVLVAYARYCRPGAPNDCDAPDARKRTPPGDPAAGYLAFVLRAGERQPRVFPLGDAQRIDRLVQEWYAAVSQAPPLLPPAARAAASRYREVASELRTVVWDPLEDALEDSRSVLIVPDGALYAVNFAALPDSAGSYLVEGPRLFHYTSAERDIAVTRAAAEGAGSVLVVGGVDFDAQLVAAGRSAGSNTDALLAGGGQATRASCEDLRNRRFQPLPGSQAEASQIALMLRSGASRPPGAPEPLVLSGAAALEEAFKAEAPGRRILHLATHAFVASGTCSSFSRRNTGSATAPGTANSSLDNPMLLSGLVFAGANHRNRVATELPEDDGLLTAQEVAALDLSSAEWVVLSGCQTGVGRIQDGEGVQGLRRAFQIAGAGTVIMSLWEVRDDTMVDWMTELYRSRLDGSTTPAAIRQAMLKAIEKERALGRPVYPYSWGALIAVGAWN